MPMLMIIAAAFSMVILALALAYKIVTQVFTIKRMRVGDVLDVEFHNADHLGKALRSQCR